MVASPLAETKTCPTGKSANSCLALIEKIFRLTRRANHLYKSGRLARKRGGSRSSRTWGGMRWTRQLQRANGVAGRVLWIRERSTGAQTNDVVADGEVVWS